MCPKPKQLNKELPEPEKGAEPQEIGSERAIEDEALFGGTPDLRIKNKAPTTGLNTKPVAGTAGMRIK